MRRSYWFEEKDNEMRKFENRRPWFHRVVITGLLLTVLLTVGTKPALSQKAEAIEATAMGTGSQMGQTYEVKLLIYEFSTADDKQNLVQAFEKGQNQGLVNALSKMRAVGRMSLTGTLGYDCSFIREFQTPTGRKIRFITNRQIRFGEAWADAQSIAYDLSGGEIDINDQDKNKSTGVFFPRAQIILDKQGEPQIDLTQNPWKLVDVLDWKGTPGVN
jgi:hypothetical protein